MKLIIGLSLLSVTLLLSGCAIVPSQVGIPLIYGHTQEPITATTTATVSKTGVACGKNILGIVTSGDFSVQAAKSNGKITNVSTVDKDITTILGVYSKVCTVVTGN